MDQTFPYSYVEDSLERALSRIAPSPFLSRPLNILTRIRKFKWNCPVLIRLHDHCLVTDLLTLVRRYAAHTWLVGLPTHTLSTLYSSVLCAIPSQRASVCFEPSSVSNNTCSKRSLICHAHRVQRTWTTSSLLVTFSISLFIHVAPIIVVVLCT